MKEKDKEEERKRIVAMLRGFLLRWADSTPGP
jgi:hypothetical protein